MKVLLENGADVNAVDDDEWTALHYAARFGHVDVVKVLIQNGTDVNAVQRQRTALHSQLGTDTSLVNFNYSALVLSFTRFTRMLSTLTQRDNPADQRPNELTEQATAWKQR